MAIGPLFPQSGSAVHPMFGQNHRTWRDFSDAASCSEEVCDMASPDHLAASIGVRQSENRRQSQESIQYGGFYAGFSPDAIDEFESMGTRKYYENGSFLFREGQAPECVFAVIEGVIKLSLDSPDGRRLTHRVARRGDIVGMTSVILDRPYDSAAETIHPCKIAAVSKREFLAFLLRFPEAQAVVMKMLSAQYMELCQTLRMLSLNSTAAGKLARLLLNWSASGEPTKGGTRFRFFMTHEQVGQFFGASRETVTRTLADFKQKGLIEVEGSMITIPSKLALLKIAGV